MCFIKTAQAAIAKYHGLGGFYNRNLFFHNSGKLEVMVKVLALSGSDEGLLLGL